jgi:hypothetical protein
VGLVRHRAREHSDALAERLPDQAERELDLPLEEVQRVLREFKERHYADWPDLPLPALDGKTPRDAVRTRHGRTQVDLLVRQMENSEERLPAGERFDVAGLRARLGLVVLGR